MAGIRKSRHRSLLMKIRPVVVLVRHKRRYADSGTCHRICNQTDFMHNEDNTVEMKIFYDADTKVILSAQFLSTADVTQVANTLSLAITLK